METIVDFAIDEKSCIRLISSTSKFDLDTYNTLVIVNILLKNTQPFVMPSGITLFEFVSEIESAAEEGYKLKQIESTQEANLLTEQYNMALLELHLSSEKVFDKIDRLLESCIFSYSVMVWMYEMENDIYLEVGNLFPYFEKYNEFELKSKYNEWMRSDYRAIRVKMQQKCIEDWRETVINIKKSKSLKM
jgi:primosomal replication protein N